MSRQLKRQVQRDLAKQAVNMTPTVGFGMTITNKKFAILFWKKVWTVWAR